MTIAQLDIYFTKCVVSYVMFIFISLYYKHIHLLLLIMQNNYNLIINKSCFNIHMHIYIYIYIYIIYNLNVWNSVNITQNKHRYFEKHMYCFCFEVTQLQNLIYYCARSIIIKLFASYLYNIIFKYEFQWILNNRDDVVRCFLWVHCSDIFKCHVKLKENFIVLTVFHTYVY